MTRSADLVGRLTTKNSASVLDTLETKFVYFFKILYAYVDEEFNLTSWYVKNHAVEISKHISSF